MAAFLHFNAEQRIIACGDEGVCVCVCSEIECHFLDVIQIKCVCSPAVSSTLLEEK